MPNYDIVVFFSKIFKIAYIILVNTKKSEVNTPSKCEPVCDASLSVDHIY